MQGRYMLLPSKHKQEIISINVFCLTSRRVLLDYTSKVITQLIYTNSVVVLVCDHCPLFVIYGVFFNMGISRIS